MVALLAVLSGAMALPVCGSIRHKSSAEPKTPMGPQHLKARPRVANGLLLEQPTLRTSGFAGRCGQVGNHHSLSLEEEAGVNLVPPPLSAEEVFLSGAYDNDPKILVSTALAWTVAT
jgi:hypothetical protein